MDVKKILPVAIFFCTSTYVCGWVERKTHVIEHDASVNAHNNELIVEHIVKKPFSQLMFGFNAFRPSDQLTFYVQVRKKNTQQWGSWHHAYTWSASIQKSHESSFDGHSSYKHVRLEVPAENADAYKVKIVADHFHDIKKIHAIHVTCARNSLFTKETEAQLLPHLSPVEIDAIPQISQLLLDHHDKTSLCSPTSVSMVSSYLSKKVIDPISIANRVKDYGLNTYGSWPFNTAECWSLIGAQYHVIPTKLQGFLELYQSLTKQIPVIVSVRGSLPGALKDFPHGHLLVVTGWDQKTNSVMCHDPAALTLHEVKRKYALKDFLAAWERSARLAYLITRIEGKL